MAEKPELKKCFVVCPIGAVGSGTRAHADWLLHEIIEHVFDRYFPGRFEIVRADRIDEPGMIDAQIINHLLEDDLVIADMSELNANAFYEMGIRHMIEKPIIHMFKKGTDIPFDVKLYRAIPFSYEHPADLQEARAALAGAVKSAIDEDHRADNPVIRARGVVKLEATSTPELQVIQEEIARLRFRISEMESAAAVTSTGFHKRRPTYRITPHADGSVELEIDFEEFISAKNKNKVLSSLRRGLRGKNIKAAEWHDGTLVLNTTGLPSRENVDAFVVEIEELLTIPF